MARESSIQKNLSRKRKIDSDKAKRQSLKAKIMDKSTPMDERMKMVFELSKMRRNGAENRYKNRCELTGRPQGYYRKFKLCRNKIREMASEGNLPGIVKSSW